MKAPHLEGEGGRFKMSEQCKALGGPVQPLNCHGCATKECEFKERQLERVMNGGPTKVAVTFVLVACLSLSFRAWQSFLCCFNTL
jgi:hypothetical protein